MQEQEQNFELRSEKVRSLIGKVPSKLMSYGILIIGGILILLFTLTHFLPYKKIYRGTIVIKNIPYDECLDSIHLSLPLFFIGNKPSKAICSKSVLILEPPQINIEGTLNDLSLQRDTLGRMMAHCTMPSSLKKIENSEVDFVLISDDGSILQQVFLSLLKE